MPPSKEIEGTHGSRRRTAPNAGSGAAGQLPVSSSPRKSRRMYKLTSLTGVFVVFVCFALLLLFVGRPSYKAGGEVAGQHLTAGQSTLQGWALIMPHMHEGPHGEMEVWPLLKAEPALCHTTPGVSRKVADVQPIWVTTRPAAEVRALLIKRGVKSAKEVPVPPLALKGSVSWHAWAFPTADLRAALNYTTAAGAQDDRCFGAVLTVVAPAAAPPTKKSGWRVEQLIDAGLHTPAGATGSHFVVLSSFLAPTRAVYSLPEDTAEERRRTPTGFLDALWHTLQGNDGRVLAAQCGMMEATSPPPADAVTEPVPVPLTDLSGYRMLDHGGFVGGTTDGKHLLPFLTRRYSTYRGRDQRVMWEEVVDAASLYCAAFHRGQYDAVGGFAGVLAHVERTTSGQSNTPGRPRGIRAAEDALGWMLGIRQQQLAEDWQVRSSRAVAVLRGGESPHTKSLHTAVYALTDDYGRSVADVVRQLQQRRVGRPWRARLTAPATLSHHKNKSAGLLLPPVLTYYTDFPCACCGLSREAMGYVRPLLERYALSFEKQRNYCEKDGAQLLKMGYPPHHSAVFGELTQDERQFWSSRLHERVPLNFLHVRAQRYKQTLKRARRSPLGLSVGRSLSEFSNVPADWLPGLREHADQVWVTADFFRHIYVENAVPAAKVRVVPEAVDVYEYDPANVQPLPMPLSSQRLNMDNRPELSAEERKKRYVFLSIFKWEMRKGWDVLLGAYWDAFGPNAPPDMRERTTLILKINFKTRYSRGLNARNLLEYLRNWANETGALPGFTDVSQLPHIIVIGQPFSDAELIQLYAAADAFVFPSRGEGWGLPAAEAMAMGLPSLLTAWSGLLGFMTPNTSYYIPLDGVAEVPRKSAYDHEESKKWALPSRNGTASLMRHVMQHPEEAKAVGRRARQLMVEQFSEEAVADKMDALFTAKFVDQIH